MGERIRALREARGMSRAVLAQLCGRGPDWLKKIESGDRELRSYQLLMRLAAALQVNDLSKITGEAPPVTVPLPVPSATLDHPVLPQVWDAVMGRAVKSEPPSEEPNPARLQGRVDQLWRLWHSSPRNRTEVGALLPALIREAETAVRVLDGDRRRDALKTLSEIYRLTGSVTAYIVPAELAWVVADRAMSAAQQADDPHSIAAAAWTLGNILRETAYPEQALSTVLDAADLLRPHLESAPDDWRGVYGALQLHAAITLAREGKEAEAWAAWDKGDQVAKSLPSSYVHPATVFGRANVDLIGVSVATDLQKSQDALERASEIDPGLMPSVERQARQWVEVARGEMQANNPTAALYVMQRACETGIETVRYTPWARTVTTWVFRNAPRGLRREAGVLAELVGVSTPG
jgi:transcriptional regulator with XRE-family HTH domain